MLYSIELVNMIKSLLSVNPIVRPSTKVLLAMPVLLPAVAQAPATWLAKGLQPRPYSPVQSIAERRRKMSALFSFVSTCTRL